MVKRFLLVLVAFAVVLAGLQIFGGRDFTQVSLAWDKYTHGGDLSSFASDVGTIFAGDKIKEGVLPSSAYNEKVMYRWKDEYGVTHISERKPNVDNYEAIKMGDLDYQIEKSLTKDELEAAKQKDKDKGKK